MTLQQGPIGDTGDGDIRASRGTRCPQCPNKTWVSCICPYRVQLDEACAATAGSAPSS